MPIRTRKPSHMAEQDDQYEHALRVAQNTVDDSLKSLLDLLDNPPAITNDSVKDQLNYFLWLGKMTFHYADVVGDQMAVANLLLDALGRSSPAGTRSKLDRLKRSMAWDKLMPRELVENSPGKFTYQK